MASDFTGQVCVEPSLDELLAEPIIRMIMQRDGVQVREMRKQFNNWQHRAYYRPATLQ